jgi:molybdenum cofactor biosynthesis enzyme MoaA
MPWWNQFYFTVQKYGRYENIKIIEQVHLQFCKRILKVRTTTELHGVWGTGEVSSRN